MNVTDKQLQRRQIKKGWSFFSEIEEKFDSSFEEEVKFQTHGT